MDGSRRTRSTRRAARMVWGSASGVRMPPQEAAAGILDKYGMTQRSFMLDVPYHLQPAGSIGGYRPDFSAYLLVDPSLFPRLLSGRMDKPPWRAYLLKLLLITDLSMREDSK